MKSLKAAARGTKRSRWNFSRLQGIIRMIRMCYFCTPSHLPLPTKIVFTIYVTLVCRLAIDEAGS